MPVPAPSPPRYVELVRVSSVGQAARDTPQDQRSALDRLRLFRPGRLVERIEQQVSGAADGTSRPDLLRLAELAATRAFDEVRVRHLDRLTRHEDPLERAAVLSMVRRAGAVIVDAGGSVLDPATMGGELTWVVSTLASAEERRKILTRTLEAKKRLAAEGRLSHGTPPWGRTFDKRTGTWGLDPKAAATYRRLFDLVLRGKTLRQIVALMNAEGVPTAKGREWSPGALFNALHARHAVGRYAAHGIAIPIPPIVDEATQAAALARLRANDHASGRHDPHPALLRKLLVCGVCGGAMYTDARHNKRCDGVFYYCASRSPDCRRMHRVEVVDEAVRAAVDAWLRRPGALEAAAGRTDGDGAGDAQEAAEEAKRELRDLDRQEERIARLLRKRMITERTGAKQLEEVARLRAAAERQAEDAAARLESAARRKELAAEVEARVAALRAGLGRARFKDWRQVMEILFDRSQGHAVAIWPDGRIETRGALPRDDTGEAALREAGREPSRASRSSGQIPVRLVAGAPRSSRRPYGEEKTVSAAARFPEGR